MNKAAQLSIMLEKLSVAEGIKLIEKSTEAAVFFDVIEDAMCIMHDDGSVNIIEHVGRGAITVEVISSEIYHRILLSLHV